MAYRWGVTRVFRRVGIASRSLASACLAVGLVGGVLLASGAIGDPAGAAPVTSDGPGADGALLAAMRIPATLPDPIFRPPPRPKTVDAAVPRAVRAILGGVSGDKPLPYFDGCHVPLGGHMTSASCLYGNLASKTTIALYGDSHLLAWFPAVLRLAQDRGWRVLDLTMSACIPADIVPYAPGTGIMRSCQAWRKAAIAKLARYRPAVLLVSGTRGFETVNGSGSVITGTARTKAWTAGMARTRRKRVPIAGRVIMLADTPVSSLNSPAACLAAHPLHSIACAQPVLHAVNYPWLNTELHAAIVGHAAFIDAERWVCPSSPCPEVIGSYVVHRNAGHITASFNRTLWHRLETAILAIRASTTWIVGP